MLKKITKIAPLAILALSVTACSYNKPQKTGSASQTMNKNQSVASIDLKNSNKNSLKKQYSVRTAVFKPSRKAQNRHYRRPQSNNSFAQKLSNAALGRLRSRVRYDGSYVKIAYPWGDVPANMGVCTDVVIRSYRKLGIDLQQQVHRDMSQSFNAYPRIAKWKLSRPDTNIDHRRVYNLRAFFARQGAALPITRNPRDYRPGDLVTWMVGPGLPHIGIVVDRPSKADPRRKMIVHNIANGPEMEDVLFRFPITGHYRYTPAHMKKLPQTDRMWVSSPSKARRNATNRKEYAQLINDAARLMKLHGNKQRSVSHQPISIANNAIARDKQSSSQKLTLAQAKLSHLTSAQLTSLLKE